MADLTDVWDATGGSTTPEPSDVVSGVVKRMLTSLNWVPSGRAPGLHCSELYGFCPRKKLFASLDPIDGVRDVDALTMARFNYGSALHDLYQNQYLGPAGVLLGQWECRRCGHRVGGVTRDEWLPMPTGLCEKCLETTKCECDWPEGGAVDRHCQLCHRGPIWRYVELPVRDAETGYIGHTDGVLATSPFSLLELKSCGPRPYAYLKKPYDSHILQANLYMRPLQIEQARIVYIDKGNTDVGIVKEFLIQYDEALVERTLVLIRQYRSAEKNKQFPPRLLGCKTRDCPWASRCYDDDYVEELVEEWRGQKG